MVDQTGNRRGRGYWKFNSSLLHDTVFLEQMNLFIDNKLKEGSNLPPIDKWLFLKREMADFAQSYSKQRGQERSLIISQLSEKLHEMEYNLSQEFNANMAMLLNNTKDELEELLWERAKGTMFRAKATWHEFGEMNSKYFYNLEKRRYNSQVCSKLLSAEFDTELTDQNDILKEQERYYRVLYQSDPTIHFSIVNATGTKISANTDANLEVPFTKKEIAIALMRLKSGKTPGEDGLTAEFIKVFYGHLGETLFQMISEAFHQCALPDKICTGIINLIPKANKDTRKLKNMRPITLLNTDYKIIEKAIANRLDSMLEDIIGKDQRGFMKNRRILVNIRKVFDIMCYAE